VLSVVEEATRVFSGEGDEAGLSQALALTGRLRFWAGETVAALHDLERAAVHARNAGDRYQEADCLQYVLAAIMYGPTPAADALVRLAEIRHRVQENRRLEVTVLIHGARYAAMEGDFDGARAMIARANSVAEGGNEVERHSHLSTAAGRIELLAGDAAAAERVLRPACERLQLIGELGYLSSAAPLLLEALYRLGRDEEALRVSERWHPDRLTVPEDVDAQVAWRSVRAKFLARGGEVAEAESLARQAVAQASTTDDIQLRAEALTALAEVLRTAGSPEQSEIAFAEAIALYERKGNVVAAATVRAMSVEPPVGV
jgi:tetratricopeptide (TPR) repeat protein